jgi:hypothetical protein
MEVALYEDIAAAYLAARNPLKAVKWLIDGRNIVAFNVRLWNSTYERLPPLRRR